ncbi:MAG: DNA-binding protein HU [Phycisphaerae bacterium]|jgi:DNA-binding protein HU-beta|nr:DNA-binding protein HU [Phycisphaerae bacterium]
MNKTDIIELVATEMDCSKVQAGKAVEAVIKSLREGILDDGGVTITGFGAFNIKKRKPRTVRNPSTGDPMTIPAQTVVDFRTAPAFREMLERPVVGAHIEVKPVNSEYPAESNPV